jgi:hypothetical protein
MTANEKNLSNAQRHSPWPGQYQTIGALFSLDTTFKFSLELLK